jgi:D-sedoheptulose 7-phosphate isomerase
VELAPKISRAASLIASALQKGGKVILCGNGGSAAQAQHLAAELVGRYLRERRPLPALALSVDTSALTAIGNDYGFQWVFARQLRGIARSDDILIAISTSGRSPNVIEALRAASDLALISIGLSGDTGGDMPPLCDLLLNVPSAETNHIQELHLVVGHLICGLVESQISSP